MLQSLKGKFTFSNVLSLVAVFIAIGGTAYALGKNTVGTKQLKNNAVTTKKINNDAVTGDKVLESTLGTVPFATSATFAAKATTVENGSISAADLGPITTVSNTVGPIPTNSTGTPFIQCPAGSVVLSGGGAASGSGVYAVLSRKVDPQGWRYEAFNNSGSNRTITVFANCLL